MTGGRGTGLGGEAGPTHPGSTVSYGGRGGSGRNAGVRAPVVHRLPWGGTTTSAAPQLSAGHGEKAVQVPVQHLLSSAALARGQGRGGKPVEKGRAQRREGISV